MSWLTAFELLVSQMLFEKYSKRSSMLKKKSDDEINFTMDKGKGHCIINPIYPYFHFLLQFAETIFDKKNEKIFLTKYSQSIAFYWFSKKQFFRKIAKIT